MEENNMAYIKPRSKYTTISISEELMNEIKKHLAVNPSYNSIADFVRTSVRDRIDMENGFQKRSQLSVSELNQEWAETKELLIKLVKSKNLV